MLPEESSSVTSFLSASQFKNSAQQHPAVSRQVSSDRFQSDLLADMFADSQGQRQTQTVFCSQSTLPPKSHNAIATALALAAASAAAASYSRREISSTSALLSQPSTNSPHNNRLTPSCLSTIASIALQPIDKKLSRRTCSYCGVLKPTPAALERHIRKHTGERPFVCEVLAFFNGLSALSIVIATLPLQLPLSQVVSSGCSVCVPEL